MTGIDHSPSTSVLRLLWWCVVAGIVAAIASLLLAGCGGAGASSSPTGSSTPTVSQSLSSTTLPGGSTAGTAGSGSTAGTAVAGGTTASSGAQAPTSGDWPVYQHDPARSGVSDDQQALGAVKQMWTSPRLDGAVYAQPLIVGDRVFVATEGNSIYALAIADGSVMWQKNLGEPVPGNALPCGNIDPSGITGTPAIDVETGVLYAVANLRSGPHHELFALDLTDATVKWQRAIDPPGLQPTVEQERGALALVGGNAYVPFGGLYGDCGQYRGAVVSSPADGSGGLNSYVVPTSRMGGIWNPAGPAVGGGGDLWVTTGNSAGRSTFDFGNAVIRLDEGLAVLDYFAPANWAELNAGDVDLGSLGPVLLSGGRVLAMGKGGVAYLLNAGDLGHVGGELTSLDVGRAAFGAAAVQGGRVFIPTTTALIALDVQADKLSVAWQAGGGSCPPLVAGGAVWAIGYDGTLRAFDPASGTEVYSADLGGVVSRFVSGSAAGGMLCAPAGDTVVAFALR